jgi:hypothetical protein
LNETNQMNQINQINKTNQINPSRVPCLSLQGRKILCYIL